MHHQFDDDHDGGPHEDRDESRERDHLLAADVAAVGQQAGLHALRRPTRKAVVGQARVAGRSAAAVAPVRTHDAGGPGSVVLLPDLVAVRVAHIVVKVVAGEAAHASRGRAAHASSAARHAR